MSILQQVHNNMQRILRSIADEAAVASGMSAEGVNSPVVRLPKFWSSDG